MRYAIVDCRMSDRCSRALEGFADRIIKMPPHPSLPAPVASHPDMLLFFADGVAFKYADYECESLGDIFEVRDVSVLPRAEYPNDIALNCARVGDKIIANAAHASAELLQYARERGMTVLNTRQGYAKCSTAVVSENAIITADASIARVARAAGIDTLQIRAGHIGLDGYDTGFIGGACGATDTEVLFCGNIEAHPDGAEIIEFCRRHGKRAVALSDEPLYDYGTVMWA